MNSQKVKAIMIIAMLSVAEGVRIIQQKASSSHSIRAMDKKDSKTMGAGALDALRTDQSVREQMAFLHAQMEGDPHLKELVYELRMAIETLKPSQEQVKQVAERLHEALEEPKLQEQLERFGQFMESNELVKGQINNALLECVTFAQEESDTRRTDNWSPTAFQHETSAFRLPIGANRLRPARKSLQSVETGYAPSSDSMKTESHETGLNSEMAQAARRFMLGLGVALSTASAASAAAGTPWSTKELYDQTNAGKVERASISSNGKEVTAVDVDGNRHQALILADQAGDLIKLFQQKDVSFTIQPDEQKVDSNLIGGLLNFAPFLLFLGLPLLLSRMGGGGDGGGPMNPMGVGKSQSKIQMEPQTGVTFADVAGCDGGKQELNEVVDFLKDPSKYSALGAKIPKGVIMEGPPGTGKTLLARAVAGEAGVPFVSASGSEFVEMFVGVGASRVRDLFGQAKKNAPCIVFIDEIDAIGKQRAGGGGGGGGGGNDEREQTLNQILTEMDGFEGNTGVIVIAATNRADILDSALIRPGRFDRRVPVDLPDVKGRMEILKVHVRGKPLSSNLDLGIVAKRTTGFSGAGLANLMNEAAIVAARNGKKEISYDEVDYAIDRATVGMQKTTGMSFPERQRLVAYHEAGHAIMGLLSPDYDMVTKVTIIPRTSGAGGFTLFTPPEERLETGMYTKRYLDCQLAVALGGRVAEEIAYGKEEITTGASNDLQQVRNIARRMVAQWGFANEGMGVAPVAWESPNGNTWDQPRATSETTEREIDAQVKILVSKAYELTLKTLTDNRVFMDEMTQRLVEEETLDYIQLLEMKDQFAVVPLRPDERRLLDERNGAAEAASPVLAQNAVAAFHIPGGRDKAGIIQGKKALRASSTRMDSDRCYYGDLDANGNVLAGGRTRVERGTPLMPSPSNTPVEVVNAQFLAFSRDYDSQSIGDAFAHVSPKIVNQHKLDAEKFKNILQGSQMQGIIGCHEWNVTDTVSIGSDHVQVSLRVLPKPIPGCMKFSGVADQGGITWPTYWKWDLGKVQEGPLEGCWMLEHMIPEAPPAPVN